MNRKKPIDTHIGQRLKEYRQHRGMTVRELADAAKVTPGQISHYEHGRDRISHERVTEFARILRIKSNDLYQPPGSRLRRNHVRSRLMSFMAAMIAEAAALMSSRREAAADDEASMVAAVADNEATMVAAVAVGASAAAASDASAGEKFSLTTSADDTAVGSTTLQLDASDAANAINAAESQGRGDTVAYHPPMSAAGEQTSAQSTSAENGITETASGNKDHSAFQFKPSMDYHAVTDPEINDIAKEQPEHPNNLKVADNDDDPGQASHYDSNGTVMSDAASDKFIFGKGFDHDTIADYKPDMTEIDHAVPAAIQHLLDTAHDTNAVSALDPNHATAPQDMTVQLPHHQGDFHL